MSDEKKTALICVCVGFFRLPIRVYSDVDVQMYTLARYWLGWIRAGLS